MLFYEIAKFVKMITDLSVLVITCWIWEKNTVFLILSNVKISSPLERFKMKRVELFSKNGDSTLISKSLREL